MGTLAWGRAWPLGSLLGPTFFPTLAKSVILRTAWGDCARAPQRRAGVSLGSARCTGTAWPGAPGGPATGAASVPCAAGYFLRLFSFLAVGLLFTYIFLGVLPTDEAIYVFYIESFYCSSNQPRDNFAAPATLQRI